MKIALGADHGGYSLKDKIKDYLHNKGYVILDMGTNSSDSVDYPEYGHKVGYAVVDKEADFGILICGSGIGISIAANKIVGVRAALCTNTTMARLAREHNDANILALGERIIGEVLAFDIVDAFLESKFQDSRHQKRIAKIEVER
ncbi:ribose 5-phosphate isomerase B [Fusobacterium sp. PH5-44]|uniref:ribose 5-phosphate isomerase B n=1 Tax=unclassified Fusobacterium TaxID=2648384 RepID=UPI003D25874B